MYYPKFRKKSFILENAINFALFHLMLPVDLVSGILL